jgi:oligopeptide/dipeptide ABC transporter ATP-binding protein
LFVAHDLSVVNHISDHVAVMYVGQIVEVAETKALFSSPGHPYTSLLLSAIPEPDPRTRRRRVRPAAQTDTVSIQTNPAGPRQLLLQGEVANPAAPPSGCYFHPRCQYAVDTCTTVPPTLREIEPGRFVRCHRATELDLPGVAPRHSGPLP